MLIQKKASHATKAKKTKIVDDVYNRKRRNKSAEFTIQRNEMLYKNPIKKVWTSMEFKYQQTK